MLLKCKLYPKTYDAYIMLYFYKSKDKNGNDTLSAHYIAADYNPSTDKFTGYNINNVTIEQKDLSFSFSLRINVDTMFGESIIRINRKTPIPALMEAMTDIDRLLS